MSDSQTAPLTDEERAELEELRAEKARREEEERARRDRAELEALRAERAAAEAGAQAEVETAAAQPVRPSAAPAAARSTASPAKHPADPARPSPSEPSAPQEKTFGQRMVTSASTDDDGIPSMPPAQKIIIAVCLVLVLAFVLWSVFK